MDAFYPFSPAPCFFYLALHKYPDAPVIALGGMEYLIAPWLTVLVLMVFQITLRRSRIRTSHLMRCTISSADVTPILIGSALLLARLVLRERLIAYDVASFMPIVTIVLLWLI